MTLAELEKLKKNLTKVEQQIIVFEGYYSDYYNAFMADGKIDDDEQGQLDTAKDSINAYRQQATKLRQQINRAASVVPKKKKKQKKKKEDSSGLEVGIDISAPGDDKPTFSITVAKDKLAVGIKPYSKDVSAQVNFPTGIPGLDLFVGGGVGIECSAELGTEFKEDKNEVSVGVEAKATFSGTINGGVEVLLAAQMGAEMKLASSIKAAGKAAYNGKKVTWDTGITGDLVLESSLFIGVSSKIKAITGELKYSIKIGSLELLKFHGISWTNKGFNGKPSFSKGKDIAKLQKEAKALYDKFKKEYDKYAGAIKAFINGVADVAKKTVELAEDGYNAAKDVAEDTYDFVVGKSIADVINEQIKSGAISMHGY